MKIELSDYPLITSILQESENNRLLDGFINILEKINETIEKKEIINPDFNDVKYHINLIVPRIFNIAISDKYLFAGAYKSLPSELQQLSTPYELRSVPSFFKNLNKLPQYKDEPFVHESLEICKEFIALIEGITFMKNHVIKVSDKRKREKELETEKEDLWYKNMVSHKDVKQVLELLNCETENIHQNLMQRHLKQVLDILNIFKNKEAEGEKDFRKYFGKNIFALITLQNLTEQKGTYYKPDYQLIDNYASKAEELSNSYAKDIVNRFVYKNTTKIGYILTQKNNLKEVSLNNVKLGNGQVECDMNCEFEDGSKFIANTSVVLSFSKYNKPFYRYPTTFRDVILPNGEKLANSSEERMEEIFTKQNIKKKNSI